MESFHIEMRKTCQHVHDFDICSALIVRVLNAVCIWIDLSSVCVDFNMHSEKPFSSFCLEKLGLNTNDCPYKSAVRFSHCTYQTLLHWHCVCQKTLCVCTRRLWWVSGGCWLCVLMACCYAFKGWRVGSFQTRGRAGDLHLAFSPA